MAHTVFVTLRVKPDCMDALCAEVATVIPKARSEQGCVAFEPTRVADGAPVLRYFERWTDKQAFDVHNSQPYMQDLYARLGSMLDGAPEIVEVKALEG